MTGRQVIKIRQGFTLEELEQFMLKKWDMEQYNGFFIGKPTAASIESYIMLPATYRFMVIVYPRKARGLFSKDNKVILSVCPTLEGAKEDFVRSIHSHNAFYSAWKISSTLSSEAERKGPAEDALLKYTDYMRELLSAAGLTQ